MFKIRCVRYGRKAKAILTICIALVAGGCASTYKPFNLPGYSYGGNQKLLDAIEISYVNDLQYISRNRWYSRKENRWEMRAIGVKVYNGYDEQIQLSPEDITVYAGDQPCQILTPQVYSEKIRQRVGLHMLHALYGPWAISWQDDGNGNTDVDFIYIPVGALVGLGNAIRAKKANTANAADIERLQLWNKTITPGETLYAIILIQAQPGLALRFEPRQ